MHLLTGVFCQPDRPAGRGRELAIPPVKDAAKRLGVPVLQPEPGIAVFDTSSSTFGAAPSLLAGVLPRWFGDKNHLAWSFLTRQKLDVRVGQRVTDRWQAPPRALRSPTSTSAPTRNGRASRSRARCPDSVGIGITWYGVYRGQRTRKELSFLAVAANGQDGPDGVGRPPTSSSATTGLLAKLGASWRTKNWHAGMSLTTPSLGAFGSGKAAYTVSDDGHRRERRRPSRSARARERATEEDLDSEYRSSWALGGGVSRRAGGDAPLRERGMVRARGNASTVLEVPADAPGASRLTQAAAAACSTPASASSTC